MRTFLRCLAAPDLALDIVVYSETIRRLVSPGWFSLLAARDESPNAFLYSPFEGCGSSHLAAVVTGLSAHEVARVRSFVADLSRGG